MLRFWCVCYPGMLARMPRNLLRFFARSRFARQPCLLIGALHLGALVVIASGKSAAADDIMVTKAPAISSSATFAYDWSGFYAGGHVAFSVGRANSTLSDPGPTASTNPFNSQYGGLQAGYNYVLPSRLLFGIEND